eukprot:CAMPEP_0176419642 /NCGR_PEP_ID=MMETSP0127-20121128/8167_1 /TAXON_ID=938130 /ORGANISM="Platyophrya macrostoma, Strain WH" /LENGTH=348 /DNA_ID=CAMNT_0017800155 /DNA_START=28 /DNA_END=1074 /DNA_ORIENTATION=-
MTKTEDAKPPQQDGAVAADMNAGEKIWTLLFGFGVPYSLVMFYLTQEQRIELDKRDIPQMSYGDFKMVLAAACMFYFIKNLWERLTYPLFEPLIDLKHQGLERDLRTKRTSKWVFDFFFYSTFVIWGYSIFRDFLPWMVGGRATCHSIWNYHPYRLDSKFLQEYYLVQLGGQLYKSLDQIFKKRSDSKFWEYFLHHFLALVLQVHSYVGHILCTGIITLVTFDVTDVFLSSLRAQEAFRFKIKWLFPIYYVITLLVWIYIRGIVFPVCVLSGGWTTQIFGDMYPPRNRLADPFYPLLLTFLFVMNLYWIYALAMVGIKSWRSWSYENVYDPTILKDGKGKGEAKKKEE